MLADAAHQAVAVRKGARWFRPRPGAPRSGLLFGWTSQEAAILPALLSGRFAFSSASRWRWATSPRPAALHPIPVRSHPAHVLITALQGVALRVGAVVRLKITEVKSTAVCLSGRWKRMDMSR